MDFNLTDGHNHAILSLQNVYIVNFLLPYGAAVALYLLAGFVVCLTPSGQKLINAALNKSKFAFSALFLLTGSSTNSAYSYH